MNGFQERPPAVMTWEEEKALAEVRLVEGTIRRQFTESRQFRAAARYLYALAVLFPHTNADRECTTVGVPDGQDGAWCLGCSVNATLEDFVDDDIIVEDDDETTRNARAVVNLYEVPTDG